MEEVIEQVKQAGKLLQVNISSAGLSKDMCNHTESNNKSLSHYHPERTTVLCSSFESLVTTYCPVFKQLKS